MNTNTETNNATDIYYRLIACWVICEAFAGGIMHASKLPFTGLFVSSLAVTCIILIAYFTPASFSIIRATIMVAIFKLMLSPHSPPTAYVAVFFQGLLGHLLFSRRNHFKTKALILAVLSLVESSIQRILVLVILYGNGFWQAVNVYIQKLTGEPGMTNYTMGIAIGYISIHAIAGFIVGYYTIRLASKAILWKQDKHIFSVTITNKGEIPDTSVKKKKRKIRLWLVLPWLLLLAMLIYSYMNPEKRLLPVDDAGGIVIRFILIVSGWYIFISPLVMRFLQNWLRGQQDKRKQDMEKVMSLIPGTREIFIQSWRASAQKGRFSRVPLFIKTLFVNLL